MKNKVEIEDTLLVELKEFDKKIKFSKFLIGLLMFFIPVTLIINLFGFLNVWITFMLTVGFIVGLIYFIRRLNINKILGRIHFHLLDCIINEKTPF